MPITPLLATKWVFNTEKIICVYLKHSPSMFCGIRRKTHINILFTFYEL